MVTQSTFEHINQAISTATATDWLIVDWQPLSGGDINQACRLNLISADHKVNCSYFVKLNKSQFADMFVAESHALRDIKKVKKIRVPEPVCYGVVDNWAYLLLEYIVLNTRGSTALIGKHLANFHLSGINPEGRFGYHKNNFIGTTDQINGWAHEWPQFFAEKRLLFQLELLRQKGEAGQLYHQGCMLAEQVEVFFESYTPKPSLVHGDLWSGNYAFDKEKMPVIYDPACYYADHEVDLAMLELFGRPGPRFFEAYHQVFPIDRGYSMRRPLYNLYHLLNHANLFGGSYSAQAQAVIEKLLREINGKRE